MTATIVYEGQLRTRCTHVESGNAIVTDAPRDNQGNGAAFSPTDLTATSLAACMLTTMAIKAKSMDLAFESAEASVKKIMAADPRRIAAIEVQITLPATWDEKLRTIMERVARHCPVGLSLHPDLEQRISFFYK